MSKRLYSSCLRRTVIPAVNRPTKIFNDIQMTLKLFCILVTYIPDVVVKDLIFRNTNVFEGSTVFWPPNDIGLNITPSVHPDYWLTFRSSVPGQSQSAVSQCTRNDDAIDDAEPRGTFPWKRTSANIELLCLHSDTNQTLIWFYPLGITFDWLYKLISLCVQFLLPRDAVHWRGVCYGDVAVCVFATLIYCTQMTESIIMRLSPDCSPVSLVFPYQTWTG